MNKNKGFTLIELLAVIVILAILMVITVPKILNVIENSKKNAAEISAKMYIDSINKLNSLNAIDNDTFKMIDDGEDIDVLNISDKVKIKGSKPAYGTITIINKKVTKANLCIDNYFVNYDGTTAKAMNECSTTVSNITINSKENINNKIYVGEKIKLSVTTDPENIEVYYKSSNEQVAIVNNDGLITGTGNGKAIITAYRNNIEDKIELSVTAPDIYVSNGGNDVTGDGTSEKPYENLKTAIENANNDDIIYIKAGIYDLKEIFWDSTSSLGIFDNNKNLTIYGENEKTIIKFDGANGTRRDASPITLSKNSVLRNLVYVYKPYRNANYSNAIFRGNEGTIKNVFFIIDNSYTTASYDYYNDHSLTHNVEYCTFYHTAGNVSSNYSGSGIYKNIATNVNPTGQLINVINENFTTEKENFQTIINDSKNNRSFNSANVGVFYGDHAWK